MKDVFNLIFSLFGNVVEFLKAIPVADNVSLYDFSLALLILSIVVVAFVPRVFVGSMGETQRNIEQAHADKKYAEEREKHKIGF